MKPLSVPDFFHGCVGSVYSSFASLSCHPIDICSSFGTEGPSQDPIRGKGTRKNSPRQSPPCMYPGGGAGFCTWMVQADHDQNVFHEHYHPVAHLAPPELAFLQETEQSYLMTHLKIHQKLAFHCLPWFLNCGLITGLEWCDLKKNYTHFYMLMMLLLSILCTQLIL